jgi:hypothetical protein
MLLSEQAAVTRLCTVCKKQKTPAVRCKVYTLAIYTCIMQRAIMITYTHSTAVSLLSHFVSVVSAVYLLSR